MVRVEINPIFGKKKVFLRETARAVTPFGGLAVFVEFLGRIGFAKAVDAHMPVRHRSPNSIPPAHTLTAFMMSVAAGARRFSHTSLMRADRCLHQIMGILRFPCDDTIRNLFRRYGMKQVHMFFEPMWRWMLGRLPHRDEGYTLDLDSTLFQRYGRQEGAAKGYNPQKPGRSTHHPILAVLAEAHFILHGWLRSGNSGTARGGVEFLKESISLLPEGLVLRCVHGDSGFFDDKLLAYLEDQSMKYIVVARMTKGIKNSIAGIKEWRALDGDYSVGEFTGTLMGWKTKRRFVVVRERIKEDKKAVGRKLFDIPEYAFRVFVTNMTDAPEDVWRDYNKRADMEKRILELKYDLACDDFCMRQFYATEAAFRTILMLFNLLGEFQRASGMVGYRQPSTLRAEVFLCGAILGKKGRDAVIHLSEAWGGLARRTPLIDKVKSYLFPTSPKLESTTAS